MKMLKPCPQCGGMAYGPRIVSASFDDDYYCDIRIGCNECTLCMSKLVFCLDVKKISKKAKKMVKIWNKADRKLQ